MNVLPSFFQMLSAAAGNGTGMAPPLFQKREQS